MNYNKLRKEEYDHGYKAGYVKGYTDGKTDKLQREWIPISERLPKKGEQVLCCNTNGSVFTTAITYIYENGKAQFGQHYDIIAWQPLPEPYKKGGAE